MAKKPDQRKEGDDSKKLLTTKAKDISLIRKNNKDEEAMKTREEIGKPALSAALRRI